MVDVCGRNFNGLKKLDHEVEAVSGRVQKRVVIGKLVLCVRVE